jgi:hypothetical protein
MKTIGTYSVKLLGRKSVLVSAIKHQVTLEYLHWAVCEHTGYHIMRPLSAEPGT